MKIVSVYSDGSVGVAQELVRYLNAKREDVLLIEHPFVPGGEARTTVTSYGGGEKREVVRSRRLSSNMLVRYVQCSFITFWQVRRRRADVDLFFGHANIDCLAAMAGGFGRPIKYVYVSIDFTPRRFANRCTNWIYRVMDRIAYRRVTAIWHSYPDAAKLKPYAVPAKCFETLHGNNHRRIQRKAWPDRRIHGIVFLGAANPWAHLEEALLAMRGMLRDYPDVSLDVIGGSWHPGYMDGLKRMAHELGLDRRVTWHGQIADSSVFERIMAECGVALCLYELTPDRPSWYQLPGKVFAYAACGLPTVVLDCSGPVCIREVERNGMGVVTPLDRLEECLRALFSDPVRHRELSERAAAWAAPYDWDEKFERYIAMLM